MSQILSVMELCLSPDFGGLEIYMSRCVRELGKQMRVIPVVYPGGRLEQRIIQQGSKPVSLQRKLHAMPLFAAYRLARLIDAEHIDVIHVHWTRDIPLAVLAKHLARRKVKLLSTRQMQITRPKRDPYHRFLYRQVDMHLAITEALATAMRRFLPGECAERVHALYYGVAAPETFLSIEERQQQRAKYGIGDDTFLVGLIGRIKHYKGQHLLVDAVGLARTEGEDVTALIVGHAMEISYLEDLKQKVVKQGWQDAIHFEDFVDDPQRLMQACDVVVLTTKEETFGLVLVEAMRSGVTVVGSNSGGVPEIITHEKTGLLFEPENSTDLYRQLKRLWNDREWCQQLAVAGKQYADEMFEENRHYQMLHQRITELAGKMPA